MRGLLARLASRAPVPVFVVAGEGGRRRLRWLRLRPELDVVDSPRQANVLVVAGRLPRALFAPALGVHDQMAPPRLTVVWGDEVVPVLPDAHLVAASANEDELVASVVSAHAELVAGRRGSEPHALLDYDLHPWEGVGPYGQGGKGMSGGTPYGRPLTGRAPDRDGLELDQLPVRVGPFFPPFPPGLILDVKLQGDVVQEAGVGENPFQRWPADPPLPSGTDDPFQRALSSPVPIADLEVARARHHLAWLGEALRVQGLAALGQRALRLALDLSADDGPALRRLVRMVRRSQVLGWSLGRVGATEAGQLANRPPGPVARAAGLAHDARSLDSAYHDAGFEPVVHEGGDVRARWEQRLEEAVQALELARRAGDARTTVTEVVETPRGPLTPDGALPSAALLELVPHLLAGLEWGEAVATVISLDLDLEEAARVGTAEVTR